MYIFLDRDDLGHIYIYSDRAGHIDPQLISDPFSEMYKFSAHPTVDESNDKWEAPEAEMAPRVRYRVLMEERESLLSTGSRID